jgi:prevent-host-death family protein
MVKTSPKTSTTVTSREFNQDTGRAKKAAASGPVFITDRGKPAHVLLNIEEYRRLTHTGKSIIELLAMPEAKDLNDQDLDALDFEIAQRSRAPLSEKRMEKLMNDLAEKFE